MRLALVLACLACASCSTSGGSTGDVADAGAADTEEERVWAPVLLFGSVTEFVPGAGMDAGAPTTLTDVEVCLLDHPEVTCARSDVKGEYTLAGIPAGVDVIITYSKAGYLGLALELTSSLAAGFAFVSLASEQTAQRFATAAGFTWPLAGTSVIWFTAVTPPNEAKIEGVSATASPSSGKGPYFLSPAGAYDSSLHATSSIGWGFFANVAPGDVDLTFTRPQSMCSRANKGFATTNGTMRVRAIGDRMVLVFVTC